MRVIIAGGRLSFHPREFTEVPDYSALFFQLRRPIRVNFAHAARAQRRLNLIGALAWFLQEGALVGQDYNLHRAGPFVRV